MSKHKILVFILFILFLTYLTVRQSFTLALSGDDWLMHYTIWSIFDITKQGSFLNPLSYFCTYCPHYFFLPIISHIWGYEPFYYYLVSFLVRGGVALSLFYLVRKLTKRTLPALLASSFFAVSYLGIETTDWVFNYNHYLGIGMVCIFLIQYVKSKETKKLKDSIIAGSLFAAALIISPPRMHGLFPLVLVVELGWILIEGRKYNFRKLAERIAIIFGFYFIVLSGIGDIVSLLRDHGIHFGSDWVIGGYGTTDWNIERVKEGLNTMKLMIAKGQTDFFIDPIASLGNFITPDRFWEHFSFSKISFLTYFFPITLIYGGLTYIVLYLNGLKKKIAPFFAFNLFIWLMFIYFLYKNNINTFSHPRVAYALIGGFSIIFTFWLFFLLKKTKPLLAHLLLIGMGWMFTFILFPWLIGPYGIMSAWGRYSVQQAAGLAVWMSIIFVVTIDALTKNRRWFALGNVYLLITLFIFMHISFVNDYLAHVNTYRSQQLDSKFWNKIITDVPTLDKNKLSIFLLLTDQDSAEIAEAIRFGSFGRMIMHYDITVQDNSPITVVNEYEGVLSSVYDGKFLIKHGHPNPAPIPVENVYAFSLQNKEMTDVTDQVRGKLKADLATLKKGNQLPPPTSP